MLTFDAETARVLELAYQGADITRRRRATFDVVDPKPGETILDIGCGNGLLTAELARAVGPGGQVIGVDPSTEMLRPATDRCAGFDWVLFQNGLASDLPLPDASVDKAVSVQVFEYLDDIPAALNQAFRVLGSGGRLVVGDIHFDSLIWFSEDPDRMNRMIAAWDYHFVGRDVPARLPPLMRETGFELEGITPVNFLDHDLKPDGLANMMIRLMENFAIRKQLIPEDEARDWRAEQEQLAAEGRFFFSVTYFVVSAHKP